MMVLYSMTLINSLLSHATPAHWVELTSSLERLNTSRAVIRLMSSHILEDLTNSILDYQGNMVRVIYFKKTRRVFVGGHFGMEEHEYGENAYVGDEEQDAMLDYIWTCAKLEANDGSGTYLTGYGVGDGSAKARGKGNARDMVKWRKLGFETEDLRKEFDKTGMLGLECLVRLRLDSISDANQCRVETFRTSRSLPVCTDGPRAEQSRCRTEMSSCKSLERSCRNSIGSLVYFRSRLFDLDNISTVFP